MISWQSLEYEIKACKTCPLHRSCTQKLIGQGNLHAQLMVVSDFPNAQEDKENAFFVGPKGTLLANMLRAIGIAKEQVYICNVLKCKPPKEHKPEDFEIASCGDFLLAQIELVQPDVILLLGTTALQFFKGKDYSVSQDHGIFYHYNKKIIFSTFHPAALLFKPALKYKAWEDLQTLQKKLQDMNQAANSL